MCNSDKDQEETRQELPKVRETCTTVEGHHLPAKREEEVSMGFQRLINQRKLKSIFTIL